MYNLIYIKWIFCIKAYTESLIEFMFFGVGNRYTSFMHLLIIILASNLLYTKEVNENAIKIENFRAYKVKRLII